MSWLPWSPYLALVIGLVLLRYALAAGLNALDLRRARGGVPPEFADRCTAEQYARALDYHRASLQFDWLRQTIMTAVILLFILAGGLTVIDHLARATADSLIGAGLVFIGSLILLNRLLDIPFDLWETFGLEARFGFNRTTPRTFVLDELKGLLLLVIIGAPLLALLLWFFSWAGRAAWLWAWGAFTVVGLLLTYIAPVVILPLFNKFTPLEDGPLRDALETYAQQQAIALRGVFILDGSRRSTKSNAYFTGLGRHKRIALYDTLVSRHTIGELVGVLAHEVGHWRLGHIRTGLLVQTATNGLLFFLLGLLITQAPLLEALGLASAPVGGQFPYYGGLFAAGFLFTPVTLLLGIGANWLSRRHEYQADHFAARTTGDPAALASALKQLSVDNLADLDPHPWRVFCDYSHPPVLARLRALQQFNQTATLPSPAGVSS